VIAGSGVSGKAVVARTGFEIAYVGVLAAVAVVASGTFGGPPAARAVVVMITDTVPVEFCTSPSKLRTGPGRTAAAAPSPSGAPASATGLTVSLTLIVVVVGVLPPARSLCER
jgi:hypothetical protein